MCKKRANNLLPLKEFFLFYILMYKKISRKEKKNESKGGIPILPSETNPVRLIIMVILFIL